MIMGVVNLTPDSFRGDGHLSRSVQNPSRHCDYALQLIHEGADSIDVGGESTRPHAAVVSVIEEIRRVVPAITLLRKRSKAFISVDTSKIEVARLALDAGADIVNNVMGMRASKEFLKIIRGSGAAFVLMHMRGTPRMMHLRTRYKSLIPEMLDELSISLEKCLDSGIKSDKIIIDPGIGFAKTAQQNLLILRELKKFQYLKRPILIGTSRKSFIGKIINEQVGDRSWGTAATVAAAIINGAHIIRVHDVKEMKQVAAVTDAVLNPTKVI